jgi:ubiquinone/menaquinone biosynthesis C-methylase UbiE
MDADCKRVCPVDRAGGLDNIFRGWLQNPRKILAPYIREGMTVLDVGCGPGFFTLPMARMVGNRGRVTAADLQEGMLEKLRGKIQGTEWEARIAAQRCEADRVGIAGPVDFVLLFYVVHEIPDKKALFTEIADNLNPSAKVLVAEPTFHVSKSSFEKSLAIAEEAGLVRSSGPRVPLSRTAVLRGMRPGERNP